MGTRDRQICAAVSRLLLHGPRRFVSKDGGPRRDGAVGRCMFDQRSKAGGRRIRSRRSRRPASVCSPRPRTRDVCVACDHVLPLAGADLSRAGVDLVIAQTELAVAAVTPAPQRVPGPDCAGVGKARRDSLPGISTDLRGAGAVCRIAQTELAGAVVAPAPQRVVGLDRAGVKIAGRDGLPGVAPTWRGWCGPSYRPDRAGRSCCCPSTTACRRTVLRRCEYRRPRRISRYQHRLCGAVRSVAPSRPSWPESLLPQHHSVSSDRIAQV